MATIGAKVGQAIRELREIRGLSQEALARKAKVSRLTVVRVENATQSPTLDTLERIAKALRVKLTDLLTQ